jgi:hypothetical protein
MNLWWRWWLSKGSFRLHQAVVPSAVTLDALIDGELTERPLAFSLPEAAGGHAPHAAGDLSW